MAMVAASTAPRATEREEAAPVWAGGAGPAPVDEALPDVESPVEEAVGDDEPVEDAVALPLWLVVRPLCVADRVDTAPENSLDVALEAVGVELAEEDDVLANPTCIRISSHWSPIHSS